MSNPFFKKKNYDSLEAYREMYGEEMPIGKKIDNWASQQDYAQGISSGLAAGAANSQPNGEFDIDQYAGFKGSGEGLIGGGGAIGAIIGGVGAQIGQFSKVNKNLKNLKTGVEGVTFDAYGRPVYQGGNIVQANNTLGELDNGIDKLNKTHLDPATNLFSSAFGTRRKLKRKRRQLALGIQAAQKDFNSSELAFRNQSLTQQDYYNRTNNQNRLYNLYHTQNGY